MADRQRTIAKDFSITGKGLHTGLDVTMTCKPAKENQGILIKRIDLEGEPTIQAIADHVVDTARGTTLEANGAKISTIEHVLAALVGLGIDNLTIEVNAPEAPIMDGSAQGIVEAIELAGIVSQQEDREVFEIKEKIRYKDEESGIELIAYPDDKYNISVLVDYESELVKNQFAELEDIEDFKKEIARCRTFVFYSELERLLKNQNLIKGGELNNAIIILDKEISQDEINTTTDLFQQPRIDITQSGKFLANPPLYHENEPARHKLLDIIGDLALVGYPIKARIFAKRPGHKANTEFAKVLRKFIKQELAGNKPPVYDQNQDPVYDINDIKKMLPHRPPFLLVDKIISMDGNGIVGLKNVTMNEPFFVGHFPHDPIMPGVLIVEAMAQVGGIFALSKVEDPENYLTLFMKIDQVRFKNKAVPGDTILFKLTLLSPIRRGIVHMKGQAFVGKKLATEAEMMAQLVKVK